MCKEAELKVPILGVDNAGKSSLVKRLKNGLYCGDISKVFMIVDFLDPPGPSVGFQPYKTKVPIDEYSCCGLGWRKKISTLFYDIGGGKNIRSIWKNYLAECHGCIFVINGNETEKFQEILCEIENMLMSRDDRHIRSRPILILFNLINGNDENLALFQTMFEEKNFAMVLNDEISAFPNTVSIRKVQISTYRQPMRNIRSSRKNKVSPQAAENVVEAVDPRIHESLGTFIQTILKNRKRIEIMIKSQMITKQIRIENERREKQEFTTKTDPIDSALLTE